VWVLQPRRRRPDGDTGSRSGDGRPDDGAAEAVPVANGVAVAVPEFDSAAARHVRVVHVIANAWLRIRVLGLRVAARSWAAPTPPADRTTGTTGDRAATEAGRPLPDPGDFVAAAYEAHQREIHSFALHSTRDPDVAADVTHEAFLKLLREAQAARIPDNARAWLYRVASNLIINRARHAKVADNVRRAWSGGEDSEASPEWHTLREERVAELRAALARMPRDVRVGLMLAANGFSGREIAAALGRTELATRSLLCRGRLELRRQLGASEPA